MKPFTEELRYEYPLTEDSLVVDVGAYHGNFSREISRRYNCFILGFEPVFWEEASKDQSEKVVMMRHGLAAQTKMLTFKIKGDMTGQFMDEGEERRVTTISVDCLLKYVAKIDLLKLNCEGMEYEILDRIIQLHGQNQIDNIQVQFHRLFANAEQLRNNIRESLSKTHELTYETPGLSEEHHWTWENWKRK